MKIEIFDENSRIESNVEKIQSEIFETMEDSEFKEYILGELTKIRVDLLENNKAYNENYNNTGTKDNIDRLLQERIDYLEDFLPHKRLK